MLYIAQKVAHKVANRGKGTLGGLRFFETVTYRAIRQHVLIAEN